jgi:hypothetical protein
MEEVCSRNLWVSYAHQTNVLTPQGQLDLRVSCLDGAPIAGGCTANGFNDYDVALARSGFAMDNPQEWLCSFASQYDTEATEVMAVALCLHEEPLPAECGCCPSLADSLTVKQEPKPLRFGANRIQVQCDPGQFLVLGNCMIDVPSAADISDVTMFRAGFPPTAEHPDGDHSAWGCSWYNPTGNTPQAIATASCARQLDVSHEVEYAWIPPGGVVDASARCARGILVGGGCSAAVFQKDEARILRAGMDPADPNRWLCSWRSHDAAEDIAVAVEAFCLEETIPEACACCPPLTDAIRVQQETQPLGPGTNRLQVTCEPDELLLLGNCMLDGSDSATLANVTMFRFGFLPGDDDTWGCSWNNPDAVSATAIATALCVTE